MNTNSNGEFIDVWVSEQISVEEETSLNALPTIGTSAISVLKRVSVAKSELRKKVDEMAAMVRELSDGWPDDRVRLDEISFTLQVNSDGGIKWIMGLGVSGSTTLKFKVEPRQTSKP